METDHSRNYDRRGAFLLALTSLAGWAFGMAINISTPILVNLAAVVAGGVIFNTSIAELPKEKEGQCWGNHGCFGIEVPG